MTRLWMVLWLFFFVAACFSAEEYAPVQTQVTDVRVYKPEQYLFATGARISNQLACYNLTLTQSKSDGSKPPQLSLTLDAGKFGFGPLVHFFKLRINGIDMRQLFTKAEDLLPWREKEQAGCVLKLNFDGVRFLLRLYLRPDSPVLWGSLQLADNSLEKLSDGDIEFTLIPSKLAMRGKQSVWQGEYARMVLTPVRLLEQTPQRIVLNPSDEYLIFQDRKFDGSTEEKGQGPCMIIMDYRGIEKATLRINDDWTSALYLKIKTENFKEFRFGLWQQEPRISNAEFARKIEAEKTAFKP